MPIIRRISDLFVFALCFYLVVIRDAFGVRRSSGIQARKINELGNELKAYNKSFPFEDCKVSIYEKQHDGSMLRTYKKFTFNFDRTLSSITYDDNKIIYNNKRKKRGCF